jgi:L-aminopeptidase/D-esterase-like protein
VLSGGSAYGLAAADGVTTCLAAQGIGTPVANGVIVPIVPSAILFDPGRCAPFNFRPDASFGTNACQAANSGPVAMGNVGAGAGARSGRRQGRDRHRERDAAERRRGRRHRRRQFERAPRSTPRPASSSPATSPAIRTVGRARRRSPSGAERDELLRATTIAVVATNARLTKAQANKVAQMADDGLARAIRIAHGTGDGDTVFALATGTVTANPNLNQIGGAAADALSRAIMRAITAAKGIHVGSCNVNSYCELFPNNCNRQLP